MAVFGNKTSSEELGLATNGGGDLILKCIFEYSYILCIETLFVVKSDVMNFSEAAIERIEWSEEENCLHENLLCSV